MSEWVLLYEDEPNKIHLLQVELEAAGIESKIPSEEVAQTMPFLQPTITLYVKKDDLEKARNLLKEFLSKWRAAESKDENEKT